MIGTGHAKALLSSRATRAAKMGGQACRPNSTWGRCLSSTRDSCLTRSSTLPACPATSAPSRRAVSLWAQAPQGGRINAHVASYNSVCIGQPVVSV